MEIQGKPEAFGKPGQQSMMQTGQDDAEAVI